MTNITIKDVAKYAGVSIATVSRVINKTSYVSDEIKEKVCKAIDELDYLPNSVARSLKCDYTHTIGYLVSDISNNYFTSIAGAIEDVVSDKGYNIIVCSTENQQKKEFAYLEILASKKVDGIILNTTGENDDYISEMATRGMPIVLIDRRVESEKFIGDFVTSDSIEGIYMLTCHLLGLGHTKIGIINGIRSLSSGKERFLGFIKAMNEHKIIVDEKYKYIYDGDFTIESGYKAAKYFLNMKDRPTAIIAANNKMAIGALKYMNQNNIRIPDDVSFVSYGDINNVEILYIKPTVTMLDTRLLGYKVGELILERIYKKNAIQNREVIYLPQLIQRESTKAI